MPSPAKSSAASAKKSAPKPTATKEAKSVAPPKPAAAKPAVPKSAPKAANPAPTGVMTPAERMKLIAEAAYYLAEKRGFAGGNELSDWVAAEKQVDTLAAKRR